MIISKGRNIIAMEDLGQTLDSRVPERSDHELVLAVESELKRPRPAGSQERRDVFLKMLSKPQNRGIRGISEDRTVGNWHRDSG